MDKEKINIKIWYLFLVAFIQFPLKLKGNLIYLSYMYVYGIPLIYLMLNINWVIKLYKCNKKIGFQFFKLIYIYIFLISILWPFICGTYDFSYITSYWSDIALWCIKYLFLIIVYKKNVNKKGEIEGFFEYFIRGTSLYVLVSLVSWLASPVKELMYKIIYLSNADLLKMERLEYHTRFGWTGWSGFNETMVCSVAVIMACILILNNNDDVSKQKHYLFSLIIPLIGNALYGRTGFLVSAICIALTCLFVFLKGNVRYIIIIILLFFAGQTLFTMLNERIEIFQIWYKWVFSALENYRNGGKFYDNMGSIQHLTTHMYWLPEWKTLLFGDGRYMNDDGTYYLYTDSGLMRPMLYYGIVNYIISIIAVFLLVKEFAFSVSKNGNQQNYKLIIIMLLLSIAGFEFKGESLWMFISILLPLYCCSASYKKEINNDYSINEYI